NPLAVDLCKVALWLESHSPGLPLGFLDHHVKCGDSLVGVADLNVLAEGIPDDAYTAVTGDDRRAASDYKRRNATERQGQFNLDEAPVRPGAAVEVAWKLQDMTRRGERSADDVRAKERAYAALRQQDTPWWTLKVACDLWTAAFFTPLQ